MADLLCALPLIAALLNRCVPPPPLATGYVEGEYVQVAPLVVARIAAIPGERGDHVAAGEVLATIEDDDARIALASAEAALLRAEAELSNLQQGGRTEEIDALKAAVAAARANAQRSATEAERQARLREQKVSAQAQMDTARAAADVAAATLAEAEARLAAAQLPARPGQIEAARAAVKQATAARDAADWQLRQRQLRAESAGTITDILRHPGEVAGPSAPVLAYLPEGAVKLRLYVPEPALAGVSVGTVLVVACDGCAETRARVTWVADRAEFTPPVIYSREARQKLVTMVEAAPEPGAALKPGQIVEVRAAP